MLLSLNINEKLPYYAVIFSSVRKDQDHERYNKTVVELKKSVFEQPGFLGFDTAHDLNIGITVSYWKDLKSIKDWKNHVDHLKAQKLGNENWYRYYSIRVCKVERSYACHL